MYKIGILAKAGRSLTLTRAEVGKSPFFDPQVYIDSLNFVRALRDNTLQAFVIVTEEFRPNHIHIMKQVKKHFPQTPIVVITEKLDNSYKVELAEFKKTILINFKYELKDLNGILLKLINDVSVVPRLTSRFTTGQMARVQIDQNKIHSAWVVNLAQDGACFRVFNRKLQKGDSIRIEIPLPELHKTHIIQGKVVWEKMEKLKSDEVSNSQMVGIQFVS